MTTILKHKEYKGLDGKTYFVEQYKEKWQLTPWRRYGYVSRKGIGHIISHTLWSRPNLKKLHLI